MALTDWAANLFVLETRGTALTYAVVDFANAGAKIAFRQEFSTVAPSEEWLQAQCRGVIANADAALTFTQARQPGAVDTTPVKPPPPPPPPSPPDPDVLTAQKAIGQLANLRNQVAIGIIAADDPRVLQAIGQAQTAQSFLDASQGVDQASLDATAAAISASATLLGLVTVKPQPLPPQPVPLPVV